jgi:hypothetical protein
MLNYSENKDYTVLWYKNRLLFDFFLYQLLATAMLFIYSIPLEYWFAIMEKNNKHP